MTAVANWLCVTKPLKSSPPPNSRMSRLPKANATKPMPSAAIPGAPRPARASAKPPNVVSSEPANSSRRNTGRMLVSSTTAATPDQKYEVKFCIDSW